MKDLFAPSQVTSRYRVEDPILQSFLQWQTFGHDASMKVIHQQLMHRGVEITGQLWGADGESVFWRYTTRIAPRLPEDNPKPDYLGYNRNVHCVFISRHQVAEFLNQVGL